MTAIKSIDHHSIISSDALAGLYGLYNLLAVVTVLALDILETLNDEMTHVWRKKFGITGVLYALARYIPFIINVAFLVITLGTNIGETTDKVIAGVLNSLYCIPWFIVLACTEYLFIIRAVAHNGSPRWLYYTLITLYVAELIIGLFFYISSPIIISLGIIIFPKSISPIAFGLPELTLQSILVLVIVWTIIRHRRLWTSREHCSLTTIVIQDGLWGYFFNLFGLLVVILQPFWLEGPAGQPSIQWSYVTFSVTSSRLLLNIRSSARDAGTQNSSIALSSLYFHSRHQNIEET